MQISHHPMAFLNQSNFFTMRLYYGCRCMSGHYINNSVYAGNNCRYIGFIFFAISWNVLFVSGVEVKKYPLAFQLIVKYFTDFTHDF